jgi:guanine deaminase
VQIILGQILQIAASTGELEWIPDCALVVDSAGTIVSQGAIQTLRSQWPHAPVLGRQEHILVPALIDTHIHFPQMDMIGACAPSLLPWLEQFTFPHEIRYRGRTHEVATAAQLFAEELARQGTGFAVVYSSSDEAATELLFEAVQARGLRAIIGKVSMDQHAPQELIVPRARDLAETEELIGRWHGRDGRLFYALTPRFAPSCSPELLKGLGCLASQYPDVFVQTHYAENHGEIAWVRELYPVARDYLAVYEDFGLIGPRTILAHAIHTSPEEQQRLRDRRVIVSHCPTSNLFLGSGLCPVRSYLQDSIAVTLGSDVGAGTSFSLWQTMGEAYKVGQLRGEPISPAQLLYASTRGAALALGFSKLGSLDPGFEADMQVIDLAAKPLLARRWHNARDPADRLATLMHLIDDRCIRQLYVRGRPTLDGSVRI